MKWILVLMQFSPTAYPAQTFQPIEMVDGHCGDHVPPPLRQGAFCFTVRNGELVVEEPK